MIGLTVVLFVAAVAMGLLALRLWRQERRRSEARVGALAAAVDSSASNPRDQPGSADLFTSEVASAHPAKELLFETGHRSAVQGRLLIKVAAGLAAAVTVTVLIAMTSVRRETPAAAAALPHDSSLELLSMNHTRGGTTLTVTGLVRNSGHVPAQGVAAVVSAFDRSGGLVASGRAPLNEPILGPGDESSFEVLIPAVGDVGRYRVSFRTEAGVVRHVDRRREGPVAGGGPGLRATRE